MSDIAMRVENLGKMGSVAREGWMVLSVTGNMAAVQNLCRRGIMLGQSRRPSQ